MSVIYREVERLEVLRARCTAASDTNTVQQLQMECDVLQQKVRQDLQVFFDFCRPWQYVPAAKA